MAAVGGPARRWTSPTGAWPPRPGAALRVRAERERRERRERDSGGAARRRRRYRSREAALADLRSRSVARRVGRRWPGSPSCSPTGAVAAAAGGDPRPDPPPTAADGSSFADTGRGRGSRVGSGPNYPPPPAKCSTRRSPRDRGRHGSRTGFRHRNRRVAGPGAGAGTTRLVAAVAAAADAPPRLNAARLAAHLSPLPGGATGYRRRLTVAAAALTATRLLPDLHPRGRGVEQPRVRAGGTVRRFEEAVRHAPSGPGTSTREVGEGGARWTAGTTSGRRAV